MHGLQLGAEFQFPIASPRCYRRAAAPVVPHPAGPVRRWVAVSYAACMRAATTGIVGYREVTPERAVYPSLEPGQEVPVQGYLVVTGNLQKGTACTRE
jgi:hypothetical protein